MCPECRGPLRVRRGEERVAHFFHRAEGTSCHLRLKGGVHRSVQNWLIEKLGPENCSRECHFPNIGRVADVAYQKKRIVFEVQLSPISATEIVARTEAYWSIQWHVIWILHAETFGHFHAADCEEILRSCPHYFTTIGFRTGLLWDELSTVRGGRREWYGVPPKRKVLENIEPVVVKDPPQHLSSCSYPQDLRRCLQLRREMWSCYIQGDWLSHSAHVAFSRSRWSIPLPWQWIVTTARVLWFRQISSE